MSSDKEKRIEEIKAIAEKKELSLPTASPFTIVGVGSLYANELFKEFKKHPYIASIRNVDVL